MHSLGEFIEIYSTSSSLITSILLKWHVNLAGVKHWLSHPMRFYASEDAHSFLPELIYGVARTHM